MNRPFTAAVGIENVGQYRELVREEYPREHAEPALGILMSEKTGLLGVPNRHGVIYPTFEDTAEIIESAATEERRRIPILIHYNTDNPHLIGEQLHRALSPYADAVDGVQVNGLRREHLRSLSHFKEGHPEIALILQIDEALLASGVDPLVAMLSDYQETVDYVWLDASGGYGKLLDARRLIPFIDEIAERELAAVGIAGGLHAENVDSQLRAFVEQYPTVSWDAQRGVQDKVGEGYRFSTKKARDFLIRSLALRT